MYLPKFDRTLLEPLPPQENLRYRRGTSILKSVIEKRSTFQTIQFKFQTLSNLRTAVEHHFKPPFQATPTNLGQHSAACTSLRPTFRRPCPHSGRHVTRRGRERPRCTFFFNFISFSIRCKRPISQSAVFDDYGW